MSIKAIAILDRFARETHLRRATPEDAPIVCALYARLAIEETGSELDEAQIVRVMEWARTGLATGAMVIALAEVDGEPVGEVIMQVVWSAPEDGMPTLSVFGRYVIPEARALLVGQALMRACYQVAHESGCDRIAFQLRPGRRAGFYERLGCVKAAEVYEGTI